MILSKQIEAGQRYNFKILDDVLNPFVKVICVNVHELFT